MTSPYYLPLNNLPGSGIGTHDPIPQFRPEPLKSGPLLQPCGYGSSSNAHKIFSCASTTVISRGRACCAAHQAQPCGYACCASKYGITMPICPSSLNINYINLYCNFINQFSNLRWKSDYSLSKLLDFAVYIYDQISDCNFEHPFCVLDFLAREMARGSLNNVLGQLALPQTFEQSRHLPVLCGSQRLSIVLAKIMSGLYEALWVPLENEASLGGSWQRDLRLCGF